MRVISLSLATALLITGAALAQNSETSTDTAAPPAGQTDTMQSNAPASTMTPSASMDANQMSGDSISSTCEKQASDKKLTGDAKTKWVSDCKMGKKTRQD